MNEREQDQMMYTTDTTETSTHQTESDGYTANQNGADTTSYSSSRSAAPYTGTASSTTSNTSSYTGTSSGYGSSYTRSTASGYTTNTASTGNRYTTSSSPNGGNNPSGYSYVNYYSSSGVPSQSEGGEPKKKNHFWLKALAFVAAMVIVSTASIGIYSVVQKNNDKLTGEQSSTSDSLQESLSDDAAGSNSAANALQSNGEQPSWIELAAGESAMSVTDIVEKVTPSVVGVQATFEIPNSYNYGFGFGMFGGNGNTGSSVATGIGTGIIMREDGYIVTNAHVIYDSEYGSGEATAVEIRMSDEETIYDATIVAFDVETDLAVLKVDQTGLPAAEFGDSDACQVGEMVVAIGNPLGLELQNTVTCGIISALNRKVTINDKTMTLIQTDTAINSGNSGGPLINSAGQVIGINSAKMSSSVSSSSATIEGIGFAIPMTEAKEIVNDLINYGYVTGRPQLGITCQDVSEAVSQAYNLPIGAYIISVTEGGAADEAGLQTGDVITGINGQTIQTTEELNNYKNEFNAGDTVTLTIVRNGQEHQVDVVLKEVAMNQQS